MKDQKWVKLALRVITNVALQKTEFTTDDVWSSLAVFGRALKIRATPKERRAMGVVMKQAQKFGICEPVDRIQQSNRAVCHRRPLRIWTSLLLAV